MKKEWSVSDLSKAKPMKDLEININDEYHHFTLLVTPERVVFGGCCNVGFLESGYIEREEDETLDDTLYILVDELTKYYELEETFRIIYNERM